MVEVRTRAALARPDRRLLAIGDILTNAADVAARPGADPREAASAMLAAAADCYGLCYGYSGALAVPAGVRVLARVAAVLARAAGDDVDTTTGGNHAAA